MARKKTQEIAVQEVNTPPNSEPSVIPMKARCEEVLKGLNFDMPKQWTCPVCGNTARRAHWVAQHVLDHMANKKIDPVTLKHEVKLKLKPGVRPIEID